MSALRPWIAALVLIGTACEKKSSSPTAAVPPTSGIPPLENAAAQAVGDRPTHEPSGGNPHGAMGANPHAGMQGMGGMGGMPAGHPQVGGGDPAGDQATPGDIPFDPKTVIAGALKLDKKLEAKVASGDVIYVVARAVEGGPPLAVKRLVVGAWPLAFSLDSRDAMMVGTAMKGKIVVSARVDKDGDAMTKNPGDVIGQTKPIEPPAKDVVLMLDSVL